MAGMIPPSTVGAVLRRGWPASRSTLSRPRLGSDAGAEALAPAVAGV